VTDPESSAAPIEAAAEQATLLVLAKTKVPAPAIVLVAAVVGLILYPLVHPWSTGEPYRRCRDGRCPC
jgi:hypothetical protein